MEEERVEKVNPKKMTKEQVERELSKPLFTDSASDFENKMQTYINRCSTISYRE